MTKADLIDSLAKRFELPRQRAEEIVGGLFDDICSALKNSEKVKLLLLVGPSSKRVKF